MEFAVTGVYFVQHTDRRLETSDSMGTLANPLDLGCGKKYVLCIDRWGYSGPTPVLASSLRWNGGPMGFSFAKSKFEVKAYRGVQVELCPGGTGLMSY